MLKIDWGEGGNYWTAPLPGNSFEVYHKPARTEKFDFNFDNTYVSEAFQFLITTANLYIKLFF